MKALTIYQPWASLIACGAKKYETRSWKTNYRGKIAIHAGARPVLPYLHREAEKKTRLKMIEAVGNPVLLPVGGIIATAELVECWEIHGTRGRGASSKEVYIDKYDPENDVTIIDGDELLFGDFTPGRYAWEFANVKMLPEPIAARGAQRLWEWEVSQ